MPKSIKYDTQTSIWVYNNGTLKNKFGIQDADKLLDTEKYIVNMNMAMLLVSDVIQGPLDKNYLFKIHKFLFEDLYDFAGKIRNENIVKGDTLFCQFHLINEQLDSLFEQFKNEKPCNKEELAKVITHYYTEINIIHPFREGNGRVIRVFFKQYALKYGYKLVFDKMNEDELLEATIYTVSNDESKLYEVIYRSLE